MGVAKFILERRNSSLWGLVMYGSGGLWFSGNYVWSIALIFAAVIPVVALEMWYEEKAK